MGWLSNLWRKVSAGSADDLTVVSKLVIPGETFAGQPIRADECYVELYVESLRLEKARRFATTFHGVVYAFQTLAREADVVANIASISKPEKLAQLDGKSLGKVITVGRKLTGAVPWRGGTLHLELGLFSVKSGNLLSPVLDFVTQVSTTAGASFIGAVTPFVPLLTKGMDMIAGQVDDVALEVAFDSDLDLNATETFAIIAKPKGQMDIRKISVDPSDRKLLLDGSALDCGYCVFSIRQTRQKADYGEIPELKEKFAALVTAIKSKNQDVAADALTSFRLAALTSPDLIPSDADALIAKATDKVTKAFAGAGATRSASRSPSQAGKTVVVDDMAESLADLPLYGAR